MPAPRPLEADDDGGEEAEGVLLDFEPDDLEGQLRALDVVDRSNKVGRTGIQAGFGAAMVTITEYALAYPKVDLDPWAKGVQDHFPPVFTGALFVVLAVIAAAYMNRSRT